MKFLRRILGLFVMLAGILGLVLSLAGLVGVWVVKPKVAVNAQTIVDTLNANVSTSQKAMQVTGQALGATVESVDALSDMLGTTAASMEDTRPVFDQINSIMGDTLPSTLESATDSLNTAQKAAEVLEGAIKSLENFRTAISAAPLIGALVQLPEETYNPEKPLADSLGDIASNLKDLPETFTDISTNLDKADEKLVSIQSDLTTMSDSVKLISKSLGEYQAMIVQSQSSIDNLKLILANIQNNLPAILNGAAIALSLFFVWLLLSQVVIFSQGWELYQGTAGHMESGTAADRSSDAEPAAEG